MTDVPIKLREVTEEDINFICDSWKMSLYHRRCSELYKNSVHKWMPRPERDDYFKALQKQIDELMSISDVRIACNPYNEWHIFGWAAVQPPRIVNYVYVRSSMQRNGVAKALLHGIDLDNLITEERKSDTGSRIRRKEVGRLTRKDDLRSRDDKSPH